MERVRAKGSNALLRRRLSMLVYRDAARAYGVGVGLVLMPLVYLFREWPPWVIRDTLHGLAASERAWVMAAAHAVYGIATAPLVRQLLASERLRWWWALPLSAGWWRALHLRHLVLLDAPWLVAIAYGMTTLAARDGLVPAITSGVAFGALTLAGQVALVSVADRSPAWLGGAVAGWGMMVVAGWAMTVAIAVLVPGPLALALAVLLLLAAARRLGRPLPEARARARGFAGGPPVVALARVGWLAVRRRDGVALGWGVTVQVLTVGLAALAIVHVGATEPETTHALLRGLAVVAAAVGTALVLRAVRLVDGDRPLMDTWGIEPRHERHARLLLAGCGVLPALLLGSLLLPWLGPVGRAWPLDLVITTAWAGVGMVRVTYGLEASRNRLYDSRLPRQLLWLGLALVLVGFAGTIVVLLPWAALEAWRLPATQRRADLARRRFETARRDDHRS